MNIPARKGKSKARIKNKKEKYKRPKRDIQRKTRRD